MAPDRFRFDRFELDIANRQLRRDGAIVELNGRYLDALALLVREHGRLVTKDRFMAEVWRGVPVTDEALTQCIRTLRRQLGDAASRPRFIETAPKHGYRFIAPVTQPEGPDEAVGVIEARPGLSRRTARLLLGAGGAVGGAAAGLVGGVLYGLIGASEAQASGMGATSALLVLACLTTLIGLIGGAGVSFGIAAAGFGASRAAWRSVVGGAAGGMLTGAVIKLVGLDAFALLFGRSPGDITGGVEGAILGAAAGLGVWAAEPVDATGRVRRAAGVAGAAGACAGLAIVGLSGRLLAGSLDLLSGQFAESRLRLDRIGSLFGETGLGPVTHATTAGLEGLLFAACVAGAMAMTARRLSLQAGASGAEGRA